MQWIFMLVGLALGAAVGGEVVDAVLGGLVGMVLGQAIGLIRLQQRNATLQQKLSEFAERFDHGTEALYQRLVALEKRTPEGVPLAEAGPPADTAPPATSEAAAPADSAADELVWTLEIPEPEPSPAAPAHPAAAVDAWALEPQVADAPAIMARERTPEPAPEPVEPAGPDLFERAFAAARGWLFGGNTVLRIGVLLLFLGLAFLLRYASDRVVVPIELRYAGVALAAVALLALGWWLRHRRSTYALLLQGTGIGVLYLTIFAAMRLHPLLSAGQALGLLVAITVFSAMLAVLQDALGLAAAAALGGFAAPILTSTGAGSHVALFSYFALLNAGIFAIAWFKAWRLLNLIGFLGTFGIGFAWGLRSYQPELFASTEPFLLLFFLMYVGIGLLFARQRLLQASGAPEGRDALLWWSARQTDYVDGSVLFGAPLVGFGLQYALIRHIEFGPAFSALALGLFYLLLARVLAGRTAGRALLLVETCLALGVVFGSLAIPLGLDARWTSAAWAVEGAGIFWLGLRQERRLARAFALLLQAGAALAYLGSLHTGTTTLLNAAPLGALMLGVALLANVYNLRRYPAVQAWAWEARLEPLLGALGLAFLYLIAPLCFAEQGTAMLWAGAGLLTLLAGLRLRSRTFLFCAFAVQLLGGALFLSRLHGADAGAGVLGSGWMGLLSASLIGLALIVGMLLAARDPLVRDDAALMRGLGVVLLIGLAFINLAVLFVLPWRTASGVWAGSGLLILWLSLYLRQRLSFAFGLAIQVIGGAAFLLDAPLVNASFDAQGLRPFMHAGFWTPMCLALAALIGAWRLHRVAERDAAQLSGWMDFERLSQVLLAWGAGWWLFALIGEVVRFAPLPERAGIALLAIAASVALFSLLALRERWAALATACFGLGPLALVVLALSDWQAAPLAHWGWLGWGAWLAVHLWSLRRLEQGVAARVLRAAHVLGCWLLLGVLALEARALLASLAEQHNAWRWLGWALVPSLFLILLGLRERLPWPVAGHELEYRGIAAAPVALVLLAWFWLVNLFSDGAADPLPYLPLVNPLELGMLIVLAAIVQWLRGGPRLLGMDLAQHARPLQALIGASLFALLTLAVCRTAHHWLGVPFDVDAQITSMAVQAGLSIVWALIALTLMIVGHLRGRRDLWLVGAGLIGVVVAKLFFVELGNSGSLERIVSFIGVGVLMLVVGYFAPLPPKRSEEEPTPA